MSRRRANRVLSLGRKAFLVAYSGTLFTVLATALASFVFIKGVLQREIMNQQLEVARHVLKRIDAALYERYEDIQVIASEHSLENYFLALRQDPSRASALHKGLLKKLKALTYLTGPWDVLAAADPAGRIVLTTRAAEAGSRLSWNQYPKRRTGFDAAMKGRAYYSDQAVLKYNRRPSVVFSAPVRDTQYSPSPVLGAVVGTFSWPAVLEILSESPVATVLLNGDGEVIADNRSKPDRGAPPGPKRHASLSHSVPAGESRSLILSSERGILPEETLTSLVRQTGYLSYQGGGWTLVLSSPTRVAFQSADETARKLALLLMLLGLPVGFGFVYSIRRLFVRPVVAMTRVTEEITAGNLDRQVPVRSGDELGELAVSFNRMTAKLRDSQEGLEQQVRERTIEFLTANEQLAVTLKSIGDAVITIDTEGRVVLVNGVAEHLTGWSQSEARGRPVREVFQVVHETSRLPCDDPADRVLQTRGSRTLTDQAVLIARDGSERAIEDSVAPIRSEKEGRIIGTVLVFRDVTERRKLQRAVLQSEKMVAVGQLAGGIAHDLNNGLTPTIGYVSLLLQHQGLDAECRELLMEAGRSAQFCADIVARLLAFSRPSTQTKAPTSLAKLLHEYRSMLRTILPGSVEVRVQRAPDALAPVLANETELMTVLVNLAINAKDAMSEHGGVFEVQVRQVDVPETVVKTGFAAGPYVVVGVTDTGHGMSPEVLRRVFEPFFTTKPTGHGTGLGLSMAFGIVKDHCGWMEVSSTEGTGSAFHIYLPAVSVAPHPNVVSAVTVAAPKARRREVILFVDDEEMMRNLGEVFLCRLGYVVILARDGEEAVQIYERRGSEIDAIVTDMTMPKLTGRETIRRLRRLNPKAKIIACSGHSVEADERGIRAEGAHSYLRKPYTIDAIAPVLRDVLDAS